MIVLGIDVGFSSTKKTSCYCSFRIENKVISFINQPQKFDSKYNLQELVSSECFDIIIVDAPLTPMLIEQRPKAGRKVDKLFSNGIFSNSPYRGPQPSSIAVPAQGFPLYQAGMELITNMQPYKYLTISDIKSDSSKGIYEVIPKLTQSLLFPRDVVVNRTEQIDDYLFPKLFRMSGSYRHILDRILGDYLFDDEVEQYIENISPKKYHEELASIVCAFQAVLIATKKSTFVGFEGDIEGYFALPRMEYWDLEWYECLKNLISRKFKDCVII